MAPLALDDQLCFALYSATRATMAAYRDLLDDLGLTYPQYLVLLALCEEDASDCLSVTQLGERLHLDSGTLSPLIRRLEKNGLVLKRRSSRDSRRAQISLTPAGRERRSAAEAIPATILSRIRTAPKQLTELRDALHSFTDDLRAVDEAGGPSLPGSSDDLADEPA